VSLFYDHMVGSKRPVDNLVPPQKVHYFLYMTMHFHVRKSSCLWIFNSFDPPLAFTALCRFRWLGVDHIFLTDNNSTSSEADRLFLSDNFPESFLTVHSESEPRGQLKVYAWCAEEHRRSFNWAAFLDIDEFIVLRGECAPSLV
jgi:hypothetical protein